MRNSFRQILVFLEPIFLGAIHMEMLFGANARFASFWPIVQTNPVNALPEDAHFFFILLFQGENIRKRRPCVWMAKPHTCVSMMSSQHPSTSSLRPLIPRQRLITTTMADYMLVFLLEKILSLLGLLGLFSFFFYCLFVYSAQALCACYDL